MQGLTSSAGSTPVSSVSSKSSSLAAAEQGLQLGKAGVLLFQFCQHLGELALQDVFIRNQLGPQPLAAMDLKSDTSPL